MKKVIVIGAGAAGLLASIAAVQNGAKVILLEKNAVGAQKILISGKGRCNLSNSCSMEKFLAAFGTNGRFLRGAFSRFFRENLRDLLNSLGVPTKEERGGRIFPQSDKSQDVVDALIKHAKDSGVNIAYNCSVRTVLHKNGEVYGVRVDNGELLADAVIICCGGASFPKTGSNGDGFNLAKECGHTITALLPALVPLVVQEKETVLTAQGVSLKNVRLSLYTCQAQEAPLLSPTQDYGHGILGKSPKAPLLESRFGEMMMTHFGLSGPIALIESLAAAKALSLKQTISAVIDLKPALSLKELDKRLQREIESHPKRSYQNLLKELAPLKLSSMLQKLSGIDPFLPSCDIQKEQRQALAQLLKRVPFNISNTLPLSMAMVTSGGIELNEIDPKTMASKKIKGLYMAGEVLNIDADTGGFNLQAAFSTGFVAGTFAAQEN